MVLQELKRSGQRFEFSILGTDISSEVLHQARDAIYPKAMLEPVPADLRQRYVMASREPGRERNRIVPELRRVAQFHRLNLMEATYPFDLTQAAVIRRLASHLRPGGYLILGHSESMAGGGGGFGLAQVLPTVFQA